MRYLLVGIVGSLVYLLGVTLLFAEYGSLDVASLRAGMAPTPATQFAVVAMLAGVSVEVKPKAA